MIKTKYFSGTMALILLFLSEKIAYADAIEVPEKTEGISLVTAGIIMAVTLLIACLIIYLIRNKKNASNK